MNLEFSNENHGLVDAVIFKELLCKLLYETKFLVSHKKAPKEEEYLSFCSPVESPFFKTPHLEYPSLEEYKTNELTLPKNLPVDFINLSKLLTALTEEKGVLLCNAGGLYSMDSSENYQLINQAVILALRELGDFKYQLEVYSSSKVLLYSKVITNELNYHIDVDMNLLKWVNVSEKGLELLAIKFDAYNVTKTLKFLMNKCSFEANRREFLHEAIKKEDHEFAASLLAQDIKPEELERKVTQEFKQDLDMAFLEEGPCFSFRTPGNENGDDFTGMAQGKVRDRTFVTKGDVVSVYKTDKEIEHVLDYGFMENFEKMTITPKKVLLQEQDTKMLLLDKKNAKKVYYVDLEKGKVIQELQADEFNTITDIAPESKQSFLTQSQVFLGINEKHIFKLDARVKESAVAHKTYSQSNHFLSIAANMYGGFAIGNEAGEIRLYKEVGQNAKNLYPGLGQPILALDCTKDGRFVLATCKNELVLLPVCHENKNGFSQTLKNVEKATPRILRLQPKTLLKYQIKEVNFKNARFDENEKEKEKYIVVSTDELIVSWTLKNVLEGKVDKYQVKQLKDKVVSNEFKYNSEDQVMIITPKEVAVHKTLKIKEEEDEDNEEKKE